MHTLPMCMHVLNRHRYPLPQDKMSKLRTVLQLATAYLPDIPLAGAVAYGSHVMAGAVKEAGKSISGGIAT